MDITPQDATTQPISDDQELAKALAGVLPDEPDLQEVENSTVSSPVVSSTTLPPLNAATSVAAPSPVAFAPVASPVATPSAPAEPVSPLEGIKNEALNELRPLMDHIELPAEDKFDAYLMLLRSTDDTSLIEPAHAAARSIADEKRRAEALIDIVKEITYLLRKDQA